MKEFHIGDILSVITNKLLSNRGMDGVREILEYTKGEFINTTDIPKAIEECRTELLNQYPQFKGFEVQGINELNLEEYLDEQVQIFGEYFIVKPIYKEVN